ncbi:MAG: hypothetical protein JWO30_3796 [Fibrobacteres bacterium]|nr:hypothetical protein [Fibrobacterota bacterium]
MLVPKSRKLFNVSMDTQNPLNAQNRNHGLRSGRKTAQLMISRPTLSAAPDELHPENDWQASGLIDQMLAYRDWWNLPNRRPHRADRNLVKQERPLP